VCDSAQPDYHILPPLKTSCHLRLKKKKMPPNFWILNQNFQSSKTGNRLFSYGTGKGNRTGVFAVLPYTLIVNPAHFGE